MTTSDLTPARQVKVFKQTFISFPATLWRNREVGSLELGAGAQPGSGAAAREFYEGKGRQKILAKAKEAVSSLVRMKKKSVIFFMVKRMMVPWKTNHGTWENHPIEEEKHLNQTFMTLGSMLNFGGIWWMKMLCKPWLFVGFVLVLICFDHLWTKGS